MALGHAVRNKEGEKKPTRYFSSRQEKSVAKAIGGKQTANSGATDFGGKSDVHTDIWSIECKTKTSDSDSISIKKSWIDKLKGEACFDGKDYYAISFNFGPRSPNYYILDEPTFQEFVEYLNDKKQLD